MGQGLAESLYKKIPVNMRVFGESLLGSRAPITEKDFSDEDLQFIKQAYLKKKANNDSNEQLLRRELVSGTGWAADEQGNLVDSTAEYRKNVQRALDTYIKTKDKTSLGYSDYDNSGIPQGGGWLKQVAGSFNDPAYRTATTLGSFNVHEDPEHGLIVKDKYDWESVKASPGEVFSAFLQGSASPEELGNALMRTIRPDVSRDVRIKLPQN